MLLGIISDTHGHEDHTRPAVELLSTLEVDEVIHCGDIGSPGVVRLLAPWPTHYVLGNCDPPEDEPALLAEMRRHGHTLHGRFAELTFEKRRIAVLHGDDTRRFQATLDSGQYDLICYGHTHVAESRQVGSTWLLNPGALYRANPHSLATVELPALKIATIRV